MEDALCGMCEMFEETYRKRQNVEEVSYEIDDVIHFFTSYQEVLMMVFDDEFEHYVPHDSEWVMEHLNDYGYKEEKTVNGASAVDEEEDWDNPDEMI